MKTGTKEEGQRIIRAIWDNAKTPTYTKEQLQEYEDREVEEVLFNGLAYYG